MRCRADSAAPAIVIDLKALNWQNSDMLTHKGRTLLTVAEAAKRMRVKPVTIRRWLRAGRLEHAHTPGGRKLIYADALLAESGPPVDGTEPDRAA